MKTYLFYDIETTGLNKCFDQVLQFAAIRTDLSLNELERHEIHVKLTKNVIPSPYAVITHRIGVTQFTQGISELEAIQKIHALLNTPGTISVGYNSLGFDDEFLRFSFYRHLFTPYTHQYANQCGRMDIYPITLLYALFKKEALNWPENNLKLENLNKLNQLAEGDAHNAMVDVSATVALAKKLMQDAAMWSFATGYFQKTSDETRINDSSSVLHIGNQAYPMGLMVYGKIGAKDNYIAPVVFLGQHAHYKNQLLFLRLDNSEVTKTPEKTRVFKKRLGEAPLYLPLKERYLSLLSEERLTLLKESEAFLTKNIAVFETIRKHHQHEKYPEYPERDSDAALYSIGFPSPAEERLFQAFHAAKPAEKWAIAEKFADPLRQSLAFRIMDKYFPEIELPSFEDNTHPVDFRGEKKYSISDALKDIEILEKEEEKTLDAMQKGLLVELKYFLTQQTV